MEMEMPSISFTRDVLQQLVHIDLPSILYKSLHVQIATNDRVRPPASKSLPASVSRSKLADMKEILNL